MGNGLHLRPSGRIFKLLGAWTKLALGVAVAFAPLDASAQPVASEHGAADVTLARQLGNQGLELAGAGDCASAVELLTRSEALHHAPTTLDVLGECHVTLGKLVEGAEELTRVVRENIDPQAPASFRTAQDRARARLEETRPRIPKMHLIVRGASPSAALALRMDGETIPAASLGLDRPVDPGHHRVEVSAPGYRPATGDVTLREGETQTLTLQVVRLPEADLPNAEGATGGLAGGYTLSVRAPPSRTPAYVSFGIAAAGVAAGSVFGAVTLSKTSSLDKLCPTRTTCPPTAQSDIDLSKTTAWTSTISFGVGAVALLAGLYFALRGHRAEVTARRAPAPVPAARPWVALGSSGLEGSF